MEQQGQQGWWESEQAQQIAGGWTAEKQRRHDERQKQAGDRESDWKLLMQQLEQDGISFTRSSTAAAAVVQATNDEQGFRGGSKPETAKAVGSSWSTKAHIKHEKKERRRQRVEAKLGAAAESAATKSAAAESISAETDEMTKLKDPERPQRKTQEAPKMELDVSGAVDSQEPAASIAEELQGQDDKLKDQSKKEKEKRRRLKRRQKAAEAKATAAEEER